MRLVDVVPLNGASRLEALRLAGAVRDATEHPVAPAVADPAPAELGELPRVGGFRAGPRGGAVGAVDGPPVGIDDGAALAQADLGLAIGTGTDVAIEAADLTLVSGDLRAAVDAIRLSRRVLRAIKGNLFWAFAYNVAAIPLAVGPPQPDRRG